VLHAARRAAKGTPIAGSQQLLANGTCDPWPRHKFSRRARILRDVLHAVRRGERRSPDRLKVGAIAGSQQLLANGTCDPWPRHKFSRRARILRDVLRAARRAARGTPIAGSAESRCDRRIASLWAGYGNPATLSGTGVPRSPRSGDNHSKICYTIRHR